MDKVRKSVLYFVYILFINDFWKILYAKIPSIASEAMEVTAPRIVEIYRETFIKKVKNNNILIL